MRFSLRTRLVGLATALLAGTSAPLQALAHGEVHEHLVSAHGNPHAAAHGVGHGHERPAAGPERPGRAHALPNGAGEVSTPRDSHRHQHATFAAVVGPRDAMKVTSLAATPAILPTPVAGVGDHARTTVAPCEERALLARPGPEYQLPRAPRGPPLR